MGNESRNGRKIITLNFKRDNDQPIECAPDDYVECDGDDKIIQQLRKNANLKKPVEEIEFHKRLENWKRVVRGGLGGGSDGFCAAWARLYVMMRMSDRNPVKMFIEIEEKIARTPVPVDELDGWLVEACVRRLPTFEERKIMQYAYVYSYPEHWIKTKLLLRNTSVRILKARAEVNLKKMFTSIENGSRILSNSHAGTDPRPESQDALVGAALTLKKIKASVE